jgi:predicted O-methyltransferase YrrM
MTVMTEFDVLQRVLVDKPSFHMSGTAYWDATPATLGAIYKLVRPGDVTLEVGAGVSTVIFAAAGAQHTSISPDPEEHKLIKEYCHQIGVDDSNLTFIEGFSDDVLPKHLTRERTLDVALVDGAHSFPMPVVDWYYVTRSLKVGGKLLLDDVPIPATGPAFRHMSLDSNWQLEGIYDNRSAAFTLVSEPASGDDWVRQPFNRRYPDFSFAGRVGGAQLQVKHRMVSVRSAAGRRFPVLRSFYKSRVQKQQ